MRLDGKDWACDEAVELGLGGLQASAQAIAKGIVAYYQKYIDEASKKEIKERPFDSLAEG